MHAAQAPDLFILRKLCNCIFDLWREAQNWAGVAEHAQGPGSVFTKSMFFCVFSTVSGCCGTKLSVPQQTQQFFHQKRLRPAMET